MSTNPGLVPDNDPRLPDSDSRLAPTEERWPTTRLGWIALSGATGCCLLVVAFHLAMLFLWNAPQNLARERLGAPMHTWISPLFLQNWRLFAPNPRSENIHMLVQARISLPGGVKETPWVDLTKQDLDRI